LQAFDCVSLQSGETYLRSDTSINCESKGYVQFISVVTFFVALYQLIPIIWMMLLYRRVNCLNPPAFTHDKQLCLFIRDNDPTLAYLKFLFKDYNCDKWWFEIADMYRRIIFIGIVPLISPNAATRASFACILAIVSVAYFREEQPYRVDFTNFIAHVAQVLNSYIIHFNSFFPKKFSFCVHMYIFIKKPFFSPSLFFCFFPFSSLLSQSSVSW
jgi:hypothetical protein